MSPTLNLHGGPFDGQRRGVASVPAELPVELPDGRAGRYIPTGLSHSAGAASTDEPLPQPSQYSYDWVPPAD